MAYSPASTVDSVPVLHAREYEKISQLAYEHFGLDLRGSKQGLVAARLGKKLRELGLKSFQHYYDYVKADRSGAALANMVDQLTTNHTSFFREAGQDAGDERADPERQEHNTDRNVQPPPAL